jgi:predicted small lipoprotein YifL
MPLSKTAVAAATILLIASLLQACGRKGPLYIQQSPATPAVAAEQKPLNALPIQSQPVPTQTESQKQP